MSSCGWWSSRFLKLLRFFHTEFLSCTQLKVGINNLPDLQKFQLKIAFPIHGDVQVFNAEYLEYTFLGTES